MKSDMWLHDTFDSSAREHGYIAPAGYPYFRADSRKQITQSMWRAFGNCQKRAHFSYFQRLVPKSTAMPLLVGTFTHSIVTAMLNGTLPRDAAAASEAVEAWRLRMLSRRNDLIDSGVSVRWSPDELLTESQKINSMAEAWLDGWGPALDNVTPLATSLKGRVPLRYPSGRRHPTWDYGFEFDGLIEYNNALWVWELKTTAIANPMDYESDLEHDPQAWGYTWAASQIFGKPVGIVYDVLRKKVPPKPKFLQCRRAACKKVNSYEFPHMAPDELRQKSNACEDCAGSGIIGLSIASRYTTSKLLHPAIDRLRLESPKGRFELEKGAYDDMIESVRTNSSKLSWRSWRLPTHEYVSAFSKEILGVAREISRKVRLEAKGIDNWLHMRGNCAIRGRACPYRSICPPMGDEAFINFERVGGDGSPIEFATRGPDGLPF